MNNMGTENLIVVFDNVERNYRITEKDNENLRDKELAEKFGLTLQVYQEVIRDIESAYPASDKNIYYEDEENADYGIDALKYYLYDLHKTS